MSAVRARLTPEEALTRVGIAVGPKVADLGLNHGQVDLTCEPARLVEVATTLRDDPDVACRYFTFLSAVDRSEFAGGGEDKEDAEGSEGEDSEHDRRQDLEVLIHVYSPKHVIHVNVHVPVDGEAPVCPSITRVYRGAEWHERETWEMFGIHFEGHPHLVNLYLPEDFEGHPLRRSFRLPSRSIKEWPGAKDPGEAAAGGR